MAEQQGKEPKKRIRVKKPGSSKKSQTVRERTENKPTEKPRRIRKTARKLSNPLGKATRVGKKEVNLPMPDNKVGRVMKKRVRFVPKFVREAFAEIKLVTWPDRRTTINLTLAVFIFAVVFATFIGLLDYVLGELFKKLILK